MIDRQLEAYAQMHALADLVLGLVSLTDRVAALIDHPRADGLCGRDGPLADAILGWIAFGYSLRIHLNEGLLAESGSEDPRPTTPTDSPARTELMR